MPEEIKEIKRIDGSVGVNSSSEVWKAEVRNRLDGILIAVSDLTEKVVLLEQEVKK